MLARELNGRLGPSSRHGKLAPQVVDNAAKLEAKARLEGARGVGQGRALPDHLQSWSGKPRNHSAQARYVRQKTPGCSPWSKAWARCSPRSSTAPSSAMPRSSCWDASADAQGKQRAPESAARMGTAERRPLLLRERDQPLGEIMGPLELAPHEVAVPQSAQHRKQLGRSAELVAQRPGPAVGPFNLRSRIALGCDQRATDRHPEAPTPHRGAPAHRAASG